MSFAALLDVWQASTLPGTNPLTFSFDVAQMLAIGGLIWAAAKISGSVDRLSIDFKEFKETFQEYAKEQGELWVEVEKLKTQNEERRDRRHDDG